jgi:hypothetical protein
MVDEISKVRPGEGVADIGKPIRRFGHQIKIDGPAMLV